MSGRPFAAAILLLLLATVGEGFAISSLYQENSGLLAQVQDLKAQVSSISGSAYPLVVVDDLNRTVTIPREPERVVSLEPSNTEIVYSLGEGSTLVGDTSYDLWPSELNSSVSSGRVQQVGGILSSTISLGAVLTLRPDLVLAWGLGGEQSQVIQQLTSAGVPVIALAPVNMGMIYGDVLLVGRALNAYQNATAVVGEMKSVAGYVSTRLGQVERPGVFYEVWSDPLITASSSSFIGQLIGSAGGTDVFTGQEQFPTVSSEAVVKLDPGVIVATSALGSTAAQIAAQPGFDTTAAARDGRIYVVQNAALLEQPAPRMVEGMLVLAKLLHPGLFGGVNTHIFDDSTGLFNGTSLKQFA